MPFKFINLWQSREERQLKYHLAISLGANYAWAQKMRDWRLAKIERCFGLPYSPEATLELHELGYVQIPLQLLPVGRPE